MAAHIREQITAAVATAVTGLTTTGANVFRARERPLQDSELPALIVTSGGEQPSIETLGNRFTYERTMRVHVTAHVKAASAYDTTLNQVLNEIETALAAASLSGGKYIALAEVAEPEISEEGEKPVARQDFVFEVVYYTQNGVPDTAL